jgi:hypothetical protein
MSKVFSGKLALIPAEIKVGFPKTPMPKKIKAAIKIANQTLPTRNLDTA